MSTPTPVSMKDLGDSNLVPEGTYEVRVHKADYVPVPKTPGASAHYHLWTMITGPDTEYVGRYVFGNYPIAGSGSYRLRELLQVTGHEADFVLTSPDQLVGLEFRVIVAIQPAKDGWPAKNTIRKHLPRF